MNDKNITKFLDLSHQELLEELPEVSQIKDYCILIKDFFKNDISDNQFKSSLKKFGVSDKKIQKVFSLISKFKKDND